MMVFEYIQLNVTIPNPQYIIVNLIFIFPKDYMFLLYYFIQLTYLIQFSCIKSK